MTTIEIQVDSLNEDEVRAVESALTAPGGDVSVRRWPRARVLDPLTIFGLVGGAIGLVDAILSLRERWVTHRRTTKVLIRNEAGDELELTAASRDELERFLARDVAETD